jgi:hypothetical protein
MAITTLYRNPLPNLPLDTNPLDFVKPDGFIAPTEHGAGLPCYTTQVSDDFRQQVERQIELVPSPIRDLLADRGIKIVLTQSMSDIGYKLEPRRRDGRSYLNMQGAYYDRSKTTVLCEQHLSMTENKWVPSDPSAAFIVHEMGHAVDQALQISQAAYPAYIIDRVIMNSYFNAWEFQKYYAYFLTDLGIGEVIAEECALIWSGTPKENIYLDECDWRYTTAFSQSCLQYAAAHYDPAKGLCDAFKDAVYDHAHKMLLTELVKKQIFRKIAQDYADKPSSLCKEQKITPLFIGQAHTLKLAIRNILYSSGEKAVKSILKTTAPSP